MLSFDTAAVTVAYADAYAAARALSAWTGDTTAKTAALRRGQDHIAREYNGRWLTEWTDATAPDVVKMAIVEAAIVEIVTPGALAPMVTPAQAKVLTEVKGIKWEALKVGAGVDGFKPVLTHVAAMLSSVASAGSSSGTVWAERA